MRWWRWNRQETFIRYINGGIMNTEWRHCRTSTPDLSIRCKPKQRGNQTLSRGTVELTMSIVSVRNNRRQFLKHTGLGLAISALLAKGQSHSQPLQSARTIPGKIPNP